MTSLDQLKTFTTIVADTGDFEGKNIWHTLPGPLFTVAKQNAASGIRLKKNLHMSAYNVKVTPVVFYVSSTVCFIVGLSRNDQVLNWITQKLFCVLNEMID